MYIQILAPGIPIEAESLHQNPYEMPNGHLLSMMANSREFENYLTSEKDPDASRDTKRVVRDPDDPVGWEVYGGSQKFFEEAKGREPRALIQ